MSAFLEYPCLAPAKADTLCVAYHPLLARCAVGTQNGLVNMFLDDGEKIVSTVKRVDFLPGVLAWHPLLKALLIGWNDGNITLFWEFSEEEQVLKEPARAHEPCKIVMVKWNETGDKAFTSDEKGNVCIWNVNKSEIENAGKIQKDGVPNDHLIFRTRMRNKDKNFYYFGGLKGTIYFGMDEGQTVRSVANLPDGSPIIKLKYWTEKDNLVALTKNSVLYRYSITADGRLEPMKKIALGGTAGMSGDDNLLVEWISDGIVAVISANDCIIRFVELDKEGVSYTLNLSSPEERPVAMAYSVHSQTLAVSTQNKRVELFRYEATDQGPKSWTALKCNVTFETPAFLLEWGPRVSPNNIVAGLTGSVSILAEVPLGRKVYGNMGFVQITPEKFAVEKHRGNEVSLTGSTSAPARGLEVHNSNIVTWSGRKVEIFEVKENFTLSTQVVTFKSKTNYCGISTESVACCYPGRIEMCNFQGECKQTIPFGENEGHPIQLNVFGNFMVALTSQNLLRCWDLSRRVARQTGTSKAFDEATVGRITSVKINNSGSHVAFTTSVPSKGVTSRRPSNNVYIFELDKNYLITKNFENSAPIRVSWDHIDSRLLAVEHRTIEPPGGMGDTPRFNGGFREVTTFFVVPEAEDAVFQDKFLVPETSHQFLGMTVPYVYFEGKDAFPNGASKLEARLMRDFVGMENVDSVSRDAILNFSYFLAIGNMDEAYKSVKLIKNANVWENMANMCVKTRRLDVAEVCLANMGNARGTKALREGRQLAEVEAQLAIVAIELGQFNEAETLYAACGRFDLLNKLQQARNNWKGALATAGKQDRIHLRTTHYLYAKYLESICDFTGAVKQYEESDTHRREVPRMLLKAKNPQDLEAYIDNMKDKQLLEWWARFLESQGAFDKASEYYQRAGDYLSIVRLLCHTDKLEEASKVALESKDTGASYHIGRTFENKNEIEEAIQFYGRAKCFNHGIRLAIENDLENEVFNLAIQSPGSKIMLEAAKYFEDRSQWERAVQLFHRGGALSKAVELCFQSGLTNSLGKITDDLPSSADPELIKRCCEFFINHGQYEKVVVLLIVGGDIKKALEVALTNKIQITDVMCDKMSNVNVADQATKDAMYKEIARACKRQGSFHLATKMYTLAKEKNKAMKVLLRSGDTEKIIFFANKSRQPELYIMAANYLQSLEWRNQPEIMKAIMNFYTKAKAPESLGLFYIACAQVEIDDFKSYEKALGALKEAGKYIAKSKIPTREAKLTMIKKKIEVVEHFLAIREGLLTHPEEALQAATQMIESNELEDVVRIGDLYAMLVEFLYSQQQYESCMEVITRMKQQKIKMFRYLNKDVVTDIYQKTKTKIDFETGYEKEEGVEDVEDNL